MKKPKPPLDVEQVYRVTIAYEIRDREDAVECIDKISDFADKMKKADSVRVVENNCGGICWEPYITLESTRRSTLESAANKIQRYVLRFNGGVFF